MRKYLFGMTAVVSSIAFSAFMPSKFLNPKIFYYVAGTDDQKIETGHFTPGVEHSIDPFFFADSFSWSEINQFADTWFYDGSSYIKSVTIDDYETGSDGGADGQLSLQEALDSIYWYYISTGTYPFPFTTITVNGSATISNFTRADNAN